MTCDDFARQSQFDFLYSGIKEKHPGIFTNDEQARFQFMEMPMEAGWTSGAYTAAFNLADTVPAKLGGFYAAGAGRVSLAYQSLLESMYQAIGEKNPEYRTLKDQIKSHYKQMEAKLAEAMQFFRGWKQSNPSSETNFGEWLESDVMAMPHKMQVDEIRSEIKRKNTQCERIEGALGKALSIAQEKLYTDTMPLEDGRMVPRTMIGGCLPDDISRWKANKGEYDLDVTINKDQQLVTPWHETIITKTEISSCHSPKLETFVNVKRLVLDQHYSLRVKVVGLNGYPITRGSWYNDTFVRPDMKLPEGACVKTSDFFGPDGSLHLIPTSVLVMYHPVIELTISTKTYKEEIENKNKLEFYPGPLSLFGLSFDVRASLEKGVLQREDKTTMTIVPPENQQAQILGFTSVNKSVS